MQVLNSRRVTAEETWGFEIAALNPEVGGNAPGNTNTGRKRRAAGSTEQDITTHVPGTTDVMPKLPGPGMTVNGWPLLSVWPCEPHTATSPAKLQEQYMLGPKLK
jgi:hypothetical protein